VKTQLLFLPHGNRKLFLLTRYARAAMLYVYFIEELTYACGKNSC
jgi:hypothetical protein